MAILIKSSWYDPNWNGTKGAASLGEGVMSFGSSVKEKGLGNATTDEIGSLFW